MTDPSPARPNIVFIFADQMRAQAMRWAGDPNAITPNLDRFATQATCFTTAVSGCPVCCPARASLITGQYPHKHGVFLNDVTLGHDATPLAQAMAEDGYDTGYIGKWHLYGNQRGAFIPKSEHQGFAFFQARQCTHQYWDAFYYGDTPEKQIWQGYDAIAQADQACQYITDHAQKDDPFLLMLSWGPPHDPYLTAPKPFADLFDSARLKLRENVPADYEDEVREKLAGYYAHIAALDDCFGRIEKKLDELNIADNTILVFWSDHGDMVGSRKQWNKQRPWDESILVPLMIRWPNGRIEAGRKLDQPINTPDLMPTLLELAGVPIPDTVQGQSYARYIRTGQDAPADAALTACYWPFAQYHRGIGGREFRGVRTSRHSFVRSLEGPWLLFDNQQDPCQLNNLVDKPEHAALQATLDAKLSELLQRYDDPFLPGQAMLEQWHYTDLDANGAIRYVN
jgi:arylsulfatase A-like enzyme